MISNKDRIMVIVMMTAAFTSSFSQNLLTSALPSIMKDFSVDAITGQWLTTGYTLVMGVITCISALLFSKYSVPRLELTALFLFGAGCLGAFLAPTFSVLLVSRIIQACGAGMLTPMMQMSLLHIYPPERQGEAMGLTGVVVGAAPAIAPAAAGILIDSFGWRSIFLTLFVLAVLATIAGSFTLRSLKEPHPEQVELWSLFLYASGFTLFMLGVDQLKKTSFRSMYTYIMFIAGIAVLTLFVRRQKMSVKPILRVELLKYRSMSLGTSIICIAYVLMMASSILVPLYIQTVSGHSATLSGAIMVPGSALIALISPVSGKITDRAGSRIVIIAGLITLAAGCGGYILFTESTGVFPVTLFYMLRSIGIALLITACTTLAVRSLPLSCKPHAMALLNSLRLMAGALFSAVIVLIAEELSSSGSIDIHGVHAAFTVMTATAAAGLILAVWLIPSAETEREAV